MSKFIILQQVDEIDQQSNNTAVSAPQPSSVEIATDAKGMPKPTVKVYNVDPAQAAGEAIELYFQLQEEIKKRLNPPEPATKGAFEIE